MEMEKSKRSKVIVIIGPTAAGKSDLAVKIASKIGGEIISADSRQVYRGLDIGTGKITRKEMNGVPHHLLNIVSPNADFNVAHFQKTAAKKIAEIVERDKMPVIVGGTGFWIDALLYDWHFPEVRPDLKLRMRLERQAATRLFIRLAKLDPVRAETVDMYNKRRLVRALEIILTTGRSIPVWSVSSQYKHIRERTSIGGKNYEIFILGVKWSKRELEWRIYLRLIKRLGAGMIKEIKKLHESGVSWKRLDNFGLEYRYISRYLRGQLNYEQMIDETFRAIKKYAKRQITWFKRDHNIQWFDIGEKGVKKEILETVSKFLSS